MEENKNPVPDDKFSWTAQTEIKRAEVPTAPSTFVMPTVRPKRKLFTKFIVWFLGILVFLLVFIFSFPHILGVVAGSDIERPELGDLELERAEVPAAENSFLDLVRLASVMNAGELTEAEIQIEFPSAINEMEYLKSDTWEEAVMVDLLDQNQVALRAFSDAAEKASYQSVYSADPAAIKPSMPVVSFNNWRSASRLSGIRAIHLMKQGQEMEAFAEAINSVKVGSTMERAENLITIEYLVGTAIKQNGLDVLELLVDRTSLSALELEKIQNILAEQKTSSKGNFLKAEFAIYEEAMGQMAEESVAQTGWWEPPLNDFYFKPNKTLLAQAEFVRAEINSHEAACTVRPVDREYFLAKTWRLWFTENSIGKQLFSTGNIALNNVKLKKCESEARLDNIVVLLAVKRYLFDQGEYPASLTALVPDYLEDFPSDEFSGEVLHFDRDKKLIYSLGRNFTDDQGSASDDIVSSFAFSVSESATAANTSTEPNLVDSDNDGLYDIEEAWYGTDANNPDTDGDGYSDGDEVKGGFNPTGPGYLQASHNTPEGAILKLEQAQFNCDKDYFNQVFVDPFDLSLVSIMDELTLALDSDSESDMKMKILDEVYSSRVYVNEIKNIEVLEKKFISEKVVFIEYRLHYYETETSKPPAKEIMYIVSLKDSNWQVDVNEMLNFEFQKASDPEILVSLVRDAKRLSDIKQLMTANELYYSEESKYIDEIKVGEPFAGSNNTFMDEIPTNPVAATGECVGFGAYRYQSLDDGKSYELVYCLEERTGAVPAGVNKATPQGVSDRVINDSDPKEYKSCE